MYEWIQRIFMREMQPLYFDDKDIISLFFQLCLFIMFKWQNFKMRGQMLSKML